MCVMNGSITATCTVARPPDNIITQYSEDDKLIARDRIAAGL